MPSAMAKITRGAPRSGSRLWAAVASIVLFSGGGASAQTAGTQSPKAQAAYAEWRRLSQNEVNCVDQSLHVQKTDLWNLIQRGIAPSDAAVAKLRATCGAQAKVTNHATVAHRGSQALAAAVEPATDQAAAEKVAAEKAAAAKAAADKAAADKAAADKAAAEKVAAAKATAERAAADKAAVEKAAADKVVADKAAAFKTAADKAAVELAKADVASAKADAAKAQAEADRSQNEVAEKMPDATLAYAAAEARTSFIYGLISGPVLLGLGGIAFLLFYRRKSSVAQSGAVTRESATDETNGQFDRLVTAVLAELKRRDQHAPERNASELRTDEALLH